VLRFFHLVCLLLKFVSEVKGLAGVGADFAGTGPGLVPYGSGPSRALMLLVQRHSSSINVILEVAFFDGAIREEDLAHTILYPFDPGPSVD